MLSTFLNIQNVSLLILWTKKKKNVLIPIIKFPGYFYAENPV